MGLESAPQTPLSVSAREFDLGRPNVSAPNVQALADAVRQGYVSASEIQQRALAHPTLAAEAAAGPALVQAKLAQAQAEAAPGMLEAKATQAKATADRMQAEAEIADQMRRLGEEGRNHLAFLRSKGVIVSNMAPDALAQQYRDFREWETSASQAKAMQQRAVKTEYKDIGGRPSMIQTSNGFTVSPQEAPAIDEAAKAGATWLTLNPDYQTWSAKGKTTFDMTRGAVQAAPVPAAPAIPKIVDPGMVPLADTAAAPVPPAPTAAPAAPAAPSPTWDPVLGATVFPKAKERIPGEQVEKAGTAETAVSTALQMNDAYMDLVATRRKFLGPITGRAAKLALAKEWDQKVAIFQQAATSLLAPVAKGIFNETGVLSDKDVARYEGVFPSIQDTPEVGMKKLAAITKTILNAYQKKADNWEAFGYDAGPMQQTSQQAKQRVSEIYQSYGLDFAGSAEEGAVMEAIESGNYRTVGGVTKAVVPGPNGSVVYVDVDPGVVNRVTAKPAKKTAPRKADAEYIFPAKAAAVEGVTVTPRQAGNYQFK